MQVRAEKEFIKAFEKLSKTSRTAVELALEIFLEHPFHPKLRNHALKGKKYAGFRSLDAGFDLRIIFRELSDGRYEFVSLVTIGTHSKLYG